MKHLPDALIVAGAVAVPAGVALVHLAAAVIVAGLELLILGVLVATRSHHGRSG